MFAKVSKKSAVRRERVETSMGDWEIDGAVSRVGREILNNRLHPRVRGSRLPRQPETVILRGVVRRGKRPQWHYAFTKTELRSSICEAWSPPRWFLHESRPIRSFPYCPNTRSAGGQVGLLTRAICDVRFCLKISDRNNSPFSTPVLSANAECSLVARLK